MRSIRRISKLGPSALCLLVLGMTACPDAPRDNIYDPENPDKGYIALHARELGYLTVEGATVDLLRGGVVVQSDTSDGDGAVDFAEIDPGIYYIRGRTAHYADAYVGPESLWAGTWIEDQRLDICTLDFEDELLGMATVYGIAPVSGSWSIGLESGHPDLHSTPQVYQGTDTDAEACAISCCENGDQIFYFEANLCVDTSTTSDWEAGVVFRFQDELNHYRLVLTPDTLVCYCLVSGYRTILRAVAHATAAGEWHAIRVERRLNEAYLRIVLDGLVYFIIFDDIFSGGRPGLCASNCDNGGTTKVIFDDITLCLGSNLDF